MTAAVTKTDQDAAVVLSKGNSPSDSGTVNQDQPVEATIRNSCGVQINMAESGDDDDEWSTPLVIDFQTSATQNFHVNLRSMIVSQAVDLGAERKPDRTGIC